VHADVGIEDRFDHCGDGAHADKLKQLHVRIDRCPVVRADARGQDLVDISIAHDHACALIMHAQDISPLDLPVVSYWFPAMRARYGVAFACCFVARHSKRQLENVSWRLLLALAMHVVQHHIHHPLTPSFTFNLETHS
jgi:hypothetical protein